MAENISDKSHQPTPHRRQQARDAGQVPVSQELVSSAILVAGAAGLLWLGHSTALAMRHMLETQLGGAAPVTLDSQGAVTLWREMLGVVAPAVLPLVGLVLVAALLANVLQTGFRWLPQSIAADVGRLSPLAGLRRIFSWQGAGRLALAVVKIAAVVFVAGWSLYAQSDAIIGLAALQAPQVAWQATHLVLWTVLKIGAVLFFLGLVDYAFRWWKHEQSLKMTADELREELRNLQGNPQTAIRRRAIRQQQRLGQRTGSGGQHAVAASAVESVGRVE